jgi:hypothetical protein
MLARSRFSSMPIAASARAAVDSRSCNREEEVLLSDVVVIAPPRPVSASTPRARVILIRS